jgi:hypothetical protein
MGKLLPVLRTRYFDSNGDPLVGGKLYSYIAGTTTPLATFSDNEITPNTNPVILDADGYADVWLADGSTYKFVLKDSLDVTLWTIDNITGAGGGGTSLGGWSARVSHAVTDGQSATDLTSETVDGTTYSSCDYHFEILRGTTVMSNGTFTLQYVNSTWRLVTGGAQALEAHGVTFSQTQTTTVSQLEAALDVGAGNGTIKLTRRLNAA